MSEHYSLGVDRYDVVRERRDPKSGSLTRFVYARSLPFREALGMRREGWRNVPGNGVWRLRRSA
jgi:hypothetical protein